jgi:hypothetical protein
VLVGLACDKWRERQEITIQSLRQGLMEKEKVEVKGYWEKLTGEQLFQYVWTCSMRSSGATLSSVTSS